MRRLRISEGFSQRGSQREVFDAKGEPNLGGKRVREGGRDSSHGSLSFWFSGST